MYKTGISVATGTLGAGFVTMAIVKIYNIAVTRHETDTAPFWDKYDNCCGC